jgi:Ca2+-binding EF-hand superfamily protein
VQDGFLTRPDLLAGCATLGVVLNDQELETLLPLLKCNEEGSIDYRSFVSVFTERAEEGTSSL